MGIVVARRHVVLASCTLALPSAAQNAGETVPVERVAVENLCPTPQQIAFASYVTPDMLLVQGWTDVPFMGSLSVSLHAGRPFFHYAYLERSLQEMLGDLGDGGAALTLLPTNPEGSFTYRVPASRIREVPGVSRRYGAGSAVVTVSALRPPTLYRVVDRITASRDPAESTGDREGKAWRASRLFLTEDFADVRNGMLALRCS
jgi:hypothetical protein